MFGKRMNNDNKSFTILACFAIIFSAVCLLMLGLYFWRFWGSLSDIPADWDAFGSYFGSITGLLAFVGVLVTFYLSEKRNRDRYAATSERDVFFRLLDLYLNQRKAIESVTIKDTIDTSEDGFEKLSNIASDCFFLHVIYGYIKDRDDFELINQISNDALYGKKSILLLFEKFNVKKTAELKSALFCEANVSGNAGLEESFRKVNENCRRQKIKKMRDELCDNDENRGLVTYLGTMILKSLCQNGNILLIYSNANFAGDFLYEDFKHNLGQYFRTIYYLLEVVEQFKDAELYLRIFRAQLSTNELSLLLYNAASSQATDKTIDLFVKHAIFNNIAVGHPIMAVKNKEEDDLKFISRLLKHKA